MTAANGPTGVEIRRVRPDEARRTLRELVDRSPSPTAYVALARHDSVQQDDAGMLEVFDSMALRGNADARSMASGVSAAMICTMTGLAVSITGLYPVHYFRTRATRETELLADKLSL